MRIIVFEQNGSGCKKIAAIKNFARDIEITRVVNIEESLSGFIDDPETYITDDFSADLVLDYLKHPDLSHYLITICNEKNIPVVASGKKFADALTPFTCCGLGHHRRLGSYGEQFGLPEYRIKLQEDRIVALEVLRGAPCGATWEVVVRVTGTSVEEALTLLPREIQYLCSADPSSFDPITGKSPVHYAGHVHRAALLKAIDRAKSGGAGVRDSAN